jgi:PAS domain S-box-containing protein
MNNQFRQFVESSPDAIMIVNPDGRIRHANGPVASLFGYDRERLRDESVRTIVPDQPLPLFSGDPGLAKHDSRRFELVCQRGDASQFPAEVSVVRVQTGHGPTAVVTVRDMTEAQRAQFVVERSVHVLASEGRDRQLLLGHLIRAQEEERKRIAAGIHEDTIQLITVANLRLQQLRHRLRKPAEVNILDKLEEAFQLSLSRLRQLIFDLRPSGLVDGGLAAALRISLEELRAETGIAYQLDDGLTRRIPADTSVLIYRTAQEAVTNVRKHARATTVRVELTDLCIGCLVRIDDDGVGYDPADAENRPGHLGLVLMRERPALAGGWCRIESAPGAGTSVEFWVPVHRPAAERETVS